jgi:hypothetical protein
LGEAGGRFGAPSTYRTATEVNYILAADWNSDGFDDLYVTEVDYYSCPMRWLGHADGRLSLATDTGDAGCLVPVAAADLNGDGGMDLVAYYRSQPGPPSVFFADSNGAFHTGTPLPLKHNVALYGGDMFLVRDWNGDGFPDLVYVEETLSVLLNKGDGTFEDEMVCNVLTSVHQLVVVADFNRDGHLDVAAGVTDESVGVLLGMGACQFQAMTEYPPFSGVLESLAYGDLDGDGVGDLLSRTIDGSIYYLHGGTDGAFQVNLLSTGARSSDRKCPLVLEDVTGDGKVDVVVTRCLLDDPQPPVHILENTCP